MIEILNLSPQVKERSFVANVSMCGQSRDGKSASQDTRHTIAVVALDALTSCMAVLASRQYARRSTISFKSTIRIKVWNVDWCEGLHYAVSLLDEEDVQLVLEHNGNRLDGQKVWQLQHEMTALHAVML